MMSLPQVCKTLHRHFVQQLPPNIQYQIGCLAHQRHPINDYNNSDNNNDNNSDSDSSMDLLAMTGYHGAVKSPLIESLKKKSSAATLLSPLSLSTASLGGSTSTVTLSNATCTSSASTQTLSLKRSSRNIPYYASCFSPCDLPTEIFICLLEFLSPGDLWKLSQVSRSMQLQVATCMSKIQRFKYGAVRILHQEHAEAVPDLSPPRKHTVYEHTAFGASFSSFCTSSTSSTVSSCSTLASSPSSSSSSSSSPSTPSPPSSTTSTVRQQTLSRRKSTQVQSRSAYWTAQAEYLVSTIIEGTAYEPRPQSAVGKGKGLLAGTKFGRETRGQHWPSDGTGDAVAPSPETTPNSNEIQAPTSALVPATAPESLWESTAPFLIRTSTAAHSSLSVMQVQQDDAPMGIEAKDASPLPMERLDAMVDLLFDPNIVQLSHRRAIINCARYVSASIEESFKRAAKTQDPPNLTFRRNFHRHLSVAMGPYLTLFSPILEEEDEGLGLASITHSAIGTTKSKVISAPRRLGNYFQIMLWHRCISDLISLYHRVQTRHMDSACCNQNTRRRSSSRRMSTVCCRDSSATRGRDSVASLTSDYPFCCNAHSLVFTTQYPFSFVPYSIRVHIRRLVQKVQSVSNRSILSPALGGGQGENAGLRQKVQYTGPATKLKFCDGSLRSSNSRATMADSKHPYEGTAYDEDEALVRRRYRIEEQIRQDTRDKQELLALCHMACGLFLAEDHRSPNAPTTIMSLLRQGSPWSKGVWQEGEWRHAAIDLGQKSNRAATSDLSMGCSDQAVKDQGRWQRICLATIEFLAHENLTWGGNRTNAELSRLRATGNESAWIYYE